MYNLHLGDTIATYLIQILNNHPNGIGISEKINDVCKDPYAFSKPMEGQSDVYGEFYAEIEDLVLIFDISEHKKFLIITGIESKNAFDSDINFFYDK